MKQCSPQKPIKKKLKPEKTKGKCRYGTSKLEVYFMEEFLDKLGIEYVYQKEFDSLKRVFDFYIPKSLTLIELNGTYFHSDPRFYQPDKLNNMQKKNKRVDEKKLNWALLNGFVMIYVWEYDVHNNSEKVMEMLRTRLGVENKKQTIMESKKTGEFYNKKPLLPTI